MNGTPRNRWQEEVREDGRTVGGQGWQEKVHNREEWKKLLRTARNRHNLCANGMNEYFCSTYEALQPGQTIHSHPHTKYH